MEFCIILYYMIVYVCMSSILVQNKSHTVYFWMFPILVYFWDLHSNVYFWDLHSNVYLWDLHPTEIIFPLCLVFFSAVCVCLRHEFCAPGAVVQRDTTKPCMGALVRNQSGIEYEPLITFPSRYLVELSNACLHTAINQSGAPLRHLDSLGHQGRSPHNIQHKKQTTWKHLVRECKKQSISLFFVDCLAHVYFTQTKHNNNIAPLHTAQGIRCKSTPGTSVLNP